MRVVTLGLLVVATVAGAHAAEERSPLNAIGAGVVAGQVDSDRASEQIDVRGYALVGRFGINDRWGMHFSFADVEDDEGSTTEDDSYKKIDVSAVAMWRVRKPFRPYARAGASWIDFEARIGNFPEFSDDALGLSVGGGFEAGSRRVAFFLDLDYCQVDLELLPNVKDELTFRTAMVGVVYKP